MATVFDDTFSGATAGTLITARAADVGGSWSLHPNFNTLASSDNGSGLATSTVAAGPAWSRYSTPNTGGMSYTITATGKRVSTTPDNIQWGVEVRAGTTSGDKRSYRAVYIPSTGSSGVLVLYRVGGAGVATDIGGSTPTKGWVSGDTHVLALGVVWNGVTNALTVTWDGATVFSVSDATHTESATMPALWCSVQNATPPADFCIATDRVVVDAAATSAAPLFFRRVVLGY